MPVVFASAVSHAPGITAWTEAAPEDQKERLFAGYADTREKLAASGAELLLVLTSEHWANFFLDHIGAFCLGLAESYEGPVEPWLKIEKATIQGNAEFSRNLVDHCYANNFEVSFSHEMKFDHGTMVPLHFLTPEMNLPVVPVFFNTLAPPRPSPARCIELGRVIGEFVRSSELKVGLGATGGLSHDPAETNHGIIDTGFDERFLSDITTGDLQALANYSDADIAGAGAGTPEILAWFALAGALNGPQGKIISYEPIKEWATGMSVVQFDAAA